MRTRNKLRNTAFILGLLLLIPGAAYARNLRTSYFMEGATNRLQLNPALRPNRGFVNIPVGGAVGKEENII